MPIISFSKSFDIPIKIFSKFLTIIMKVLSAQFENDKIIQYGSIDFISMILIK